VRARHFRPAPRQISPSLAFCGMLIGWLFVMPLAGAAVGAAGGALGGLLVDVERSGHEAGCETCSAAMAAL
jgi:uncharacterized protein DUF1269